MTGIVYSIVTHATTRVILDAIKRNGLEKTLEDLREACPETDNIKSGELVYQGMLSSLRDMKKLERGEE